VSSLLIDPSVRPLSIGQTRRCLDAEVELDDGIWEVEGYDSSGHEIEMKVEAASGAIVKLKRDD
jgi:uncharacterized membrane protein YkoI